MSLDLNPTTKIFLRWIWDQPTHAEIFYPLPVEITSLPFLIVYAPLSRVEYPSILVPFYNGTLMAVGEEISINGKNC